MRYMGCKRRLLPFIHQVIKDHCISGETFCDLFAGTATVGHYFKQQGYRIISNDLLYCSFVQQYVKVAMNSMPSFEKLIAHLELNKQASKHPAQSIIDYLNQQKGIEGFIYQHYSPGGTENQSIQRLYFTDENAKKIDIIREMIAGWKQLALIDEGEFYILLYALLEEVSKRANTTGKQNGFLKRFHPNALRPVLLSVPLITRSNQSHCIYHGDSMALIEKLNNVDILYLDPPYTRHSYASAYHLLETIARWDRPTIQGVYGIRDTALLRSPFNQKQQAFLSLKRIIAQANYRHLLFSYSSDGLLSPEAILNLLRKYGEVSVTSQPLRRYSSQSCPDRRHSTSSSVEECLYYLKPTAVSIQPTSGTSGSYVASLTRESRFI